MIDPKLILDQPELVEAGLKKRHEEINLPALSKLLKDKNRFIAQIDERRHENKTLASEIAQIHKRTDLSSSERKEVAEPLKERSQALKSELKTLEGDLRQIEEHLNRELLYIPNLVDDSVPTGEDETANQLVREWTPSDRPLQTSGADHLAVADHLQAIDFERAGKLSGARFAILTGWGARLEMALIHFMYERQINRGYSPVIPPYLVHPNILEGTGQLPKFSEESFVIEKDDLYLIPTAEVPVTNMFRDEIIDEKQLPLSFVGFTPCFRREAGSYGKDTKGLIRQHQFHKVELVKFVHPDSSFDQLETLVADAESILQDLKLPYRVALLSTGDIGFSAAKCYDLEVWLPGQEKFREISSCSNCTDFQARRMNLRYRPSGGGKPRHLHTLNGSGIAVGRTLIAILENYWNAEEKRLEIPEALQPYLGNHQSVGVDTPFANQSQPLGARSNER